MPTDVILWLTADQWGVIASISQALAALGAISLLVLTGLAQRDGRDAIEAARTLAAATESLVVASRDQQNLAVLPVIEIMYEATAHRLRFVNKGNGALLAPHLTLDVTEVKLVSRQDEHGSYRQTAALAAGEIAFALLEGSEKPHGALSISGVMLTGAKFDRSVDLGEFAANDALVATEGP